MPGVEISVALAGERGILKNLFQFYVHDFSAQWSGTPRGELEPDGRFAPYPPLDFYWKEEGRVPLLIRSDGNLAGFALVNAVGHSGQAVDRNMAEFFVVRKHRRGGVGTVAARAIFDRYPGIWEVAVARTNPDAFAFWRRVIGEHTATRDLEEMNLTGGEWNGPVFRFRI